MNIAFHTLTSLSIAKFQTKTNYKNLLINLLVAFILGILSHGLLDHLPHKYHINSYLDVAGSAIFIMIILFLIKNNKTRLILAISFFGAIFPDIVDQAPNLINRFLGTNLPTPTIFPWHKPAYSGSIFNNLPSRISDIAHISVIVINLAILYLLHKRDSK